MNFGQAISTCFRKYVDFRGYASRPEYWWWTLFSVLVSLACAIIDGATQNDSNVLQSLWGLAVLLPSVAVLVRRLRDAGYSWAWVFIGLIPIVGPIVLIVFLASASKPPVTASPSSYYAAQ